MASGREDGQRARQLQGAHLAALHCAAHPEPTGLQETERTLPSCSAERGEGSRPCTVPRSCPTGSAVPARQEQMAGVVGVPAPRQNVTGDRWLLPLGWDPTAARGEHCEAPLSTARPTAVKGAGGMHSPQVRHSSPWSTLPIIKPPIFVPRMRPVGSIVLYKLSHDLSAQVLFFFPFCRLCVSHPPCPDSPLRPRTSCPWLLIPTISDYIKTHLTDTYTLCYAQIQPPILENTVLRISRMQLNHPWDTDF